MDVEMPVMDGIKATAAIREEGETAVVVFSFHDDQGTVDRALAAGATAFVPKQQSAEELIAAVRQAANQKEGRL
jgi:two-component system response regulator DesR